MENKFYILIFSFTFFYSFTIKGDDNIEFSIITIGPYEDELYSAFGHSGIRY